MSSEGPRARCRRSVGQSGTPGRVVGRQEIDEPAHLQQALDVVVIGAVGDRRFRRVHLRAAELLRRHVLVGHRLHHIGAGDEHVARVAHHEDEVGHRRRIDVAARARPHDDGNLRDHAGGQHIALEHLAVAAERGDAFLDARAAGIEQADDRRARLHRHVLDLDDLLRVRLDSEPPNTVKSLAKTYTMRPLTVPQPVTTPSPGIFGLVHAEIGGAMLDEHVELLEGALVHQQLDALARGQLAALVLRLDARLAAAEPGAGARRFELFHDVFHDVAPPGCSALA